jgi:fatty acid desaturase
MVLRDTAAKIVRIAGMSAVQIDHRAIIASLSASDRALLTGLTNRDGILRAALHFGAILVFAAAILIRIPFWPLLLPLEGILIIFLFTAMHETIHGTAFRSAWLNRAVSTISGFLIFIPPVWFRYFHFAHHRHTHDPDNDPELMSRKPETVAQYALYLSGLPLWTGMAKVMAANAAGIADERYVPEKGKAKVQLEARITIAAYAAFALASVAFSSPALLWAWIVPVLLGQPFLRAYLLAEHARCPHVANMLENTRTTFTTVLVRLIAWNMPFHAEHHAYPAVPFHKLPRFHQVVAEHLRTTERGYVTFHRKFASGLR